ncbi:HD domain-containing protein [Alkalibaculum sp. M08DMB]|uniref:bis(5'-nucleosyl)-tetraphosphatase (symmetrical) n=1 Tax=Alkalibaculum sporogenes TaxID=2655001 RepID=A0A6A7K9D4_9FIRM|nr:bis(5'-nucleosyl)-tetraphosphatase (symmetrical) YqeK [Alkalibaculum sporogenes]MPW25921.1 HD domain-containing protein [Alkalibaculum sporogenes]
MEYDIIEADIRLRLSERRYRHSLGVVDSAVSLAYRFGCDIEKTKIAAISHDCAKEFEIQTLVSIAKNENMDLDLVTLSEPQLLHGPVGKFVAKTELGINDEEILDAIHYHTTARANMTKLDKVIYLSDVIEVGRNYAGIEAVRELALHDLDEAIVLAIDNTINYVVSIHSLLHPRTIEARNSILLSKK